MKNVSSATVFAAIAAGTVLAAMSLTAESAAVRTADAAAQSTYMNAVAGCSRMKGSAARRCMRDAAEIKTRDTPGDAKNMDLIFREQRTPGGSTPTHWILPDVKGVPDNLAGNAAR